MKVRLRSKVSMSKFYDPEAWCCRVDVVTTYISQRFQIILLIIEEKMKRQIHSFTHTLIQNVQSQENIHL